MINKATRTAGKPSQLKDFIQEIKIKILMTGFFLIGALILYVAMPPSLQKISLEAAEPLDSKNGLEALFTVENTGVLPVFDLQFSYKVTTLETEDGLRVPGNEKPLFDPAKPVTRLWPDEKRNVAFPLKTSLVSPVRFVDMMVAVRYKPLPKIPFYVRKQSFHFMTAKKAGGLLSWYPQR